MKQKLYSAWKILLIGLTVVVGLYMSGTLMNVYLGVMAEDLHVSRSLLAVNGTLRYLIAFGLNLCVDALIRKLGLKRLILIGMISSAGMLLLFSLAHSLWICYLAGLVGSLGSCFTGLVPMTLLVRHWFPKNQGTVLAIASSMTGVAGVVMTPIVSAFIGKYGWRIGFRGLVILIAVIFLMECLFLENPSKEVRENGFSDTTSRTTSNSKVGKSHAEPEKGVVWSLIVISALFSLGALCVYSNTAVLLQDMQFPQLFATGMAVSMVSLSNIVGKFLIGRLCDGSRQMGRILLSWYALCMASCLYFVLYRGNVISLAIPGILLIGFVGGIYSLPIPLMTGKFFRDSESYTKMVGRCTAAANLSSAFAGFIFHGIYDATGTYVCSLIYAAVLSAICTALVWNLMRRINHKTDCPGLTVAKKTGGNRVWH